MTFNWYGSFPDRWDISTISRYFYIKKDIADKEGFDVLSITQKGIKVKNIDSNEGQMARSYEKYQFVNPGDFAMNHMDLKTGWVDQSVKFGVTSPDYRVFTQRDDVDCNSQYFLKLFQNCYNCRIFYALGRGAAAEGRWRLPREEFLSFPIPVPPIEEQNQIANYIEWKMSTISRFTNAKRQQVALLQEKISVLTNEAILAAENNVRLKHMVDIPRNWIERKNGVTYSPAGVLNRGRGVFHKEQLLGEDLGDSDFFELEPNALMISGQFAWEGAVALTSEKEIGCIASHRYYTIRGKKGICETAFLWAFLQTKLGDLILNLCSHGAAGRNKPLNFNELLNEYIPLPTTEKQQEIAEAVDVYIRYRETVNQMKTLLQEYRTRLISDVVTGKHDVRGVVVPDYEAVEEVVQEELAQIDDETEGDENVDE